MANGIAIGLAAFLGVWLGWLAIPVAIGMLLLFNLAGGHIPYRLLMVVALVCGIGALRSTPAGEVEPVPDLPLSSGAIGTVRGFPKPIANDRARVVLDIQELCVGEQCIPANGCVVANFPRGENALAKGDTTRVLWNVDPLPDLSAGYRSYVAGFGCSGSAWITRVEVRGHGPAPYQLLARTRALIGDRLHGLLPGDSGALAAGIVTGDDGALSPEMKQAFEDTGTTHLTAVSGQNIMLIIAFVSLWVRDSRRRTWFDVLLVAIVWSYASLVGLEPPALRAAIFATLIIIGRHVGRQPDPLTILSLTFGAMALWNPLVVHGVGFWLSVTASFALCLVLPRQLPKNPVQSMKLILAAPAVASLATMPIILSTFHTWSPVTVVANALLSPIMSVAFPICYAFTLAAVIAPWLAGLLSFVPGIAVGVALVVVENMAQLGGSIRLGEIGTVPMALLCLAVATVLVLASPESERWILRIQRTWKSL